MDDNQGIEFQKGSVDEPPTEPVPSAGPNESHAPDNLPTDDSASDSSSDSGERIFDFTNDLNIAPISATAAAAPEPTVKMPPASATPIPNIVPIKAPPAVPIAQTPPTLIPPTVEMPPVTPTTPIVPKPPAVAPIPTVIAPIKEKTSPANPPAKILGFRNSNPETDQEKAPGNLQDAISSFLPSDFEKKKSVATGAPVAASNGQTNPHASNINAPKIAGEKAKPDYKSLRTYESDIAYVMAHRKTSAASISMAETKRKKENEAIASQTEQIKPPSSHAGRKIVLIVVSLILIGSGLATAYYLYSQSPLYPQPTAPAAQQQQPAISSIVPPDSQKVLPIDNLTSNSIISAVRGEVGKTHPANSIEEIIPSTNQTGGTTKVGAQDMIGRMSISAPDILTRSVVDPWMLGIYTDSENVNSVFVIVTTNFFQNAFAGMLQWESVMPDDLKLYLYPSEVMGIANITTPPAPVVQAAPAITMIATGTATSTATTTPKNIAKTVATSTASQGSTTVSQSLPSDLIPTPLFTLRGNFVDRIIKNKDVREFITDNGNMLFLYSFVDNTHLVIAGSESALSEIITRLDKEAFIR